MNAQRARSLASVALLAVAVVVAEPALSAYLELGININGRNAPTRWSSMPIKYYLGTRTVPNVTQSQLQAATAAAFSTWAAVPTATVSSSLVGFTNAEPVREDGMTVIGFQEHDELDRTLGVTSFTLDKTTGALVEADIFLNSLFTWSTAANGETNKFDVQSVLTHEIGHLHGLGHSLLGETVLRPEGGRRVVAKRAVMFPIAYAIGTVLDRTLQDDDIAAISDTYPTAKFESSTGSIVGKVTLNGTGVFGAHVIASNTATGQTVGGFSLNTSGQFVIDGLEPGVYVIKVEPIDDADITSFFDDDGKVDANFKAAIHPALVAVPSGGAGQSIEIKVNRK